MVGLKPLPYKKKHKSTETLRMLCEDSTRIKQTIKASETGKNSPLWSLEEVWIGQQLDFDPWPVHFCCTKLPSLHHFLFYSTQQEINAELLNRIGGAWAVIRRLSLSTLDGLEANTTAIMTLSFSFPSFAST